MYKNMSTDELAEIFVDNLVATNRGFNFYVNQIAHIIDKLLGGCFEKQD